MEKIKSLIEQVKLTNKKYDELNKLTGRNFNIFDAAYMGHKEIVHTQLISELFSPSGSHNQKDKFLKIFLNVLGIKVKLKKPECYSEYLTNQGRRIDIVIEDSDFMIAIEAKIFAKDSKFQLKDYYEFLKDSKKRFKLFYLTLDGHSPDEKSLENLKINKDIFLISFKDEIYEWINESIKEVNDIPIIREGLYQYKLLLERLTNKNRQKEEEVKKIIGKDCESIKAAAEIVHNYENTWYEKELEFWVELFTFAEKKYFNDWEDGDKDIYNIWFNENGEEFDEDKILENLKKTDSRGICFKKVINNKAIYIGIEYGKNYNNCCLWYKGINKKLENYEYDKDFKYFWKFTESELRFYSKNDDNNLTFEIFDKNKFDKKKRELTKELNELKKELLG